MCQYRADHLKRDPVAIRQRRKHYLGNEDYILSVIREGAAKANLVAEETLRKAKMALQQVY